MTNRGQEGEALSTEEAIAYAQRGRGERKRPAKGWEFDPAELDIVRLLTEGLSNKDIAARLFISPNRPDPPHPHLQQAQHDLTSSGRPEAARHGDLASGESPGNEGGFET